MKLFKCHAKLLTFSVFSVSESRYSNTNKFGEEQKLANRNYSRPLLLSLYMIGELRNCNLKAGCTFKSRVALLPCALMAKQQLQSVTSTYFKSSLYRHVPNPSQRQSGICVSYIRDPFATLHLSGLSHIFLKKKTRSLIEERHPVYHFPP